MEQTLEKIIQLKIEKTELKLKLEAIEKKMAELQPIELGNITTLKDFRDKTKDLPETLILLVTGLYGSSDYNLSLRLSPDELAIDSNISTG